MALDANWAALLRSSLDGAPAERFGATTALIEHARNSVLGRRMLALRLQDESPQLFRLPAAANDAAWIPLHPAALFSGERLRGAALDLGALAFSPALRARVDRSEVLRLRSVLGAARIAFALGNDPWRGALPDAVRHCAVSGLARVIHDADALLELVRQRGRIELYAHASALHAMLGERIRLAFAPMPAGERRDAWLPPKAVARYLEAATQSATEAGQ